MFLGIPTCGLQIKLSGLLATRTKFILVLVLHSFPEYIYIFILIESVNFKKDRNHPQAPPPGRVSYYPHQPLLPLYNLHTRMRPYRNKAVYNHFRYTLTHSSGQLYIWKCCRNRKVYNKENPANTTITHYTQGYRKLQQQ